MTLKHCPGLRKLLSLLMWVREPKKYEKERSEFLTGRPRIRGNGTMEVRKTEYFTKNNVIFENLKFR
jgi:hypothetical protein